MVRAVREGQSVRSVARQFGFSHATVLMWVKRAKGVRPDRMDWSDRPSGSERAWNRTKQKIEEKVLQTRRFLKTKSTLGEFGAVAIERELRAQMIGDVPCVRTLARILKREGAVDGHGRVRRPAPPRGWYLPDVAQRRAELDSFDIIEDLRIQNGPWFSVLTGMSLHGHLAAAWPAQVMSAKFVVAKLLEHWRRWGCPTYVQFDNDTRFQGAHQFADSFGRVLRLCLQVGSIPVFAPPNETGFQAAIESFNGLWQTKVWQRWHCRSVNEVGVRNEHYLEAHRNRTEPKRDSAPSRRRLSKDFALDLRAPLRGKVIYIRRTNDEGQVALQGHLFKVSRNWPNRLARCELSLDASLVEFYALRRREPDHQRLLHTAKYVVPERPFKDR